MPPAATKRRWSVTRGLAAIGLAVAAVLVGCTAQSSPYPNKVWQVGTCMVVEGHSAAPSSVGNVPCSETHTHIVIARIGWDVRCPANTDIEDRQPDNLKFCLRVDTELRSHAP